MPRVEAIVANKFEDAAVKFVGPGLRDHVDAAGGSAAQLRRKDALSGLEFLNKFHAQHVLLCLSAEIRCSGTVGIGGVGAIYRDIHAVPGQTVKINGPSGNH